VKFTRRVVAGFLHVPAKLERHMRLELKFLLALAVLLCAGFAHADPPARAGRLNYVHGTVSFAPAQTPDTWAVATLNRPLTTGDRLWTDRDGYAELHVGSTAVRLAPRTNLDILSLDDHTLQLRVTQGDVNVRVREIADDAIEIDTPNGAVLLEAPGSYRVGTLPSDDMTNAITYSGRAHVLTQHSAFSVQANQQVALRGPDGAPSEIAGATMDAFDRWSAELDKREDQVAAARYVSPQMTGYEDLDAHGTWRTMPEYGAVWVPTVSAGWAPYRYGHWVWIEPWGWTWVDDAPWGFAPFHYGRWVWVNSYWAWAPGPRIARPVYAPAMVAFVGGSQWSVSIGSGPAVGWFPLGWREPFLPWYRTSPTYVRNVNITQVKNINIYNNVTRINYANQAVPQAVTVVSKETFVSARPVARSVISVPAGRATRAPLLKSTPAEPASTSFITQRTQSRPPETAIRREVFATRIPPERRAAPQNPATASSGGGAAARAAEPRVRIIERQRADADAPVRQRAADAPRESQPGPTMRVPQAETRTQPKTAPEKSQGAERAPRSAKEAPTHPQSDARRDEQRHPGSSRTAPPRTAPAPNPRAESAPGRPAPKAQSETPSERRAPGPPPDTRPRPKAEREPRAEREPARPAPQTRPPVRDDREGQRERRSPPQQSRPRGPDASLPRPSPQAGGSHPSQPATQPPAHAPQPQARTSRPEARSPQHAPPRAQGRPERERRNRND
jgi:hypothetical protein